MPSILIVPVPPFDERKVNALVSPVQSTFGLSVHVNLTNAIDPSFAFDMYRNQYNSTSIISAFVRRFEKHEGKVVGITSVDFFVPVLTYVFGEAQLDGPIAVVSSYRLDDTLYGLPDNPKLLEERLIKEVVHELGHTFGLIHCHDYRCVMHSSTAVEEIDVKSGRFCPACDDQLRGKIES
jgi:archaemetzincin